MKRPKFTQTLADTLLAGKHVNLISPHGRGRRQTLIDLISLLDDVQVAKIDLKREQKQWQTWFEKTLRLNGQVIVILHNIEYIKQYHKQALNALKKFTLLCVSERPLQDEGWVSIELPNQ